MRVIARGLQAVCVVGMMTALPVAAQTFTTPLVSDFEDSAYAEFFSNVAARFGGRLENGRLVVESDGKPGSGSVVVYRLREDAPTSVFVDVSVALATPDKDDDGKISGAGIVIRRGDNPLAFYGMVKQSEGYLVFAWAGNALVQSIGGSMPEGTTGDTVRLAATETESGAEFFIDGVSVATLSDSRVTGRGAGLTMFGGGTAVFDNFGLNSISDLGNKAKVPADKPRP